MMFTSFHRLMYKLPHEQDEKSSVVLLGRQFRQILTTYRDDIDDQIDKLSEEKNPQEKISTLTQEKKLCNKILTALEQKLSKKTSLDTFKALAECGVEYFSPGVISLIGVFKAFYPGEFLNSPEPFQRKITTGEIFNDAVIGKMIDFVKKPSREREKYWEPIHQLLQDVQSDLHTNLQKRAFLESFFSIFPEYYTSAIAVKFKLNLNTLWLEDYFKDLFDDRLIKFQYSSYLDTVPAVRMLLSCESSLKQRKHLARIFEDKLIKNIFNGKNFFGHDFFFTEKLMELISIFSTEDKVNLLKIIFERCCLKFKSF